MAGRKGTLRKTCEESRKGEQKDNQDGPHLYGGHQVSKNPIRFNRGNGTSPREVGPKSWGIR